MCCSEGDSHGDFRLFEIRTSDHIPSLKAAKHRHLHKGGISQAGCRSLGRRGRDPPRGVPGVSGALLGCQTYKLPKPAPSNAL